MTIFGHLEFSVSWPPNRVSARKKRKLHTRISFLLYLRSENIVQDIPHPTIANLVVLSSIVFLLSSVVFCCLRGVCRIFQFQKSSFISLRDLRVNHTKVFFSISDWTSSRQNRWSKISRILGFGNLTRSYFFIDFCAGVGLGRKDRLAQGSRKPHHIVLQFVKGVQGDFRPVGSLWGTQKIQCAKSCKIWNATTKRRVLLV